MPRAILLCGLGWDQMEVMFPDPVKREEAVNNIKGMLDDVKRQFEEAGLVLDQYNYSPNESMERWKGIVTGQKYDGIVIGGGIRTQYPKLCQDLVNTVIEHSPHSKILFNATIPGTLDTVREVFPDA